MIVRPLKPEEYALLAETPCAIYRPEDSIVVGALDEGVLHGAAALIAVPHIEGVWIEPEHRGGTLLKRLMEGIEREATRLNLPYLLAFGTDTEKSEYLRRMGYRPLPWTVWEK